MGPAIMQTATILTHARRIFLKEKIFPFLVRVSRTTKTRKVVKVHATCYTNALKKVFALHPRKFVKLKNSNMDLITAKVEAAALSKRERKIVYICVSDDGECELFDSPQGEIMATFSGGTEVKEQVEAVASKPEPKVKKITKVSAEEMKVIKENKDELRTVKREAPIKKASGKSKNKVMATVAKKKKAAKKTVTNRPSVSTEKKIPRGNNMHLTAAEWKKVDAILEKEETSFSAWSRGLVLAKIK